MIKKFRDYVKSGSFDECMESADEWIEGFCWAVIVLALVVFGPAILHVLSEGAGRILAEVLG